MSEPLSKLVDEARLALDAVASAIVDRSWQASTEASRAVLSAMSKLHARVRVLGELAVEAGYAAAEVDRALTRANRWHQATVDEQIAEAAAKPKATRRRKPKA